MCVNVASLVSFTFPTHTEEPCERSPVAMGLLDATSRRGALASSLRGQLFTWGFASSGLTGGLLGTGHGY